MLNSYTPSKESLQFIAFIRAAGIEENANAEIHYRLADKYFSKDKQVLIESFRGSAKSTLMEWLVLYTAAREVKEVISRRANINDMYMMERVLFLRL